MTKTVRFHKFGGPQVLSIEDLPTPTPAAGEVRLRMHAVGLNRADAHLYRGLSSQSPQMPSLLGSEGAGIVEEVGPGVDITWIGRRVAMLHTELVSPYGTLGEQVIAPVHALVECPESFSDSECSSLWLHHLVAYSGLVEFAGVGRGDCVLVTSPATSLGIAAIQIAKAESATTIAVAPTGRWKRELHSIGADHVLTTDADDLVADVEKITRGQGLQVIFSSLAEPLLMKAVSLLKPGGILLESEDLTNVCVASPIDVAVPAGVTVHHCSAAQLTKHPEKLAEAESYIRDRLRLGFLQIEIARKFLFPEIIDAFHYLESNEAFGKIVVTFPDQARQGV